MDAALCNRKCMCLTSCTKSFKKTLTNWKKIRIRQKGDLCNSLRIKLLRLEGETYNSHNKANFNDKV